MTDKQFFLIGGRVVFTAGTRQPLVVNAPSPATGTNPGTGSGSASGGTTPAPTPTVGTITGVAITSVNGTTAGYTWNAYTAAAVTEYSAELRPRGGAAGTSDAWAGIGRWAGPPGSKGGLADASAYELRIVAYNGTAVVAVSDPVAFTVGTVAGTGTGAGAGTGAQTGGTLPSGGSTSGALALIAKVQVPRAVTEPVVRFYQGFAPGEMGDGDRLVAALPDGTPVPLRPAARRRTWPAAMGGGVRGRTYDATLPGTYAAGQVATLTLTKQAGAADLGTAKTLAQIRADSDLKIVFSGYELGGPFQVRLNDLIDGGAPARPWGNNPTWGLDVVSANQERVSLRAWAFLRRVSDGAIHRTLKGTLYVDWVRGGGGGYLLGAAWVQDTSYGAHPAGTVGPADGPKRLRFVVEAFDGSRFLHAWGGTRDPRARTRPASAFHDSVYDPAAGQALGLDWDCGVGVGLQGAVPAGLSTGTAYYARWTDNGLGLFLNRRDGSRVAFGGAGGDVTVFPVMHSYAGQGGYGRHTDDVGRVWTGSGADPSTWFEHDQQHLFKRSRLVPPYRDDVARSPMGGTPRTHTPGEVYGGVIWAIGSPSDNPTDSRLGPIPYYAVRWLMTPHDPVSRAAALSQAVSWADFPTHFRDERSGGPVVTSRGPNGDGVTYPGQAPVNPDFASFLNDTLGSPPFGAAQKAAWRGSVENQHGYEEDYQNANGWAHTPNYWQVPYLITGDQAWLDLGVSTAATTGYLWNHTHAAKGTTYTPVITGQQRGIGWAYRDLSNVDSFLPDDDVDRAVFEDYLRIQGKFWAGRVDEAPGRHLGKPYLPGENNDIGGRPFQEYMLAMMSGMIYWRNQDPDWRKFLDCTGRYIMGAFDDQALNANGQARNGGWLANEYGLHGNDFQNVTGGGANRIWGSIDEMLRYSNEPAFGIPQAGPSPYPQYGLRRDDNDFNNDTYSYNAIAYVNMLLGALAIWSSAGIPGAKRVRNQLLRRIYDGTLREVPVNSNQGPIPQYALGPVPGSPE